mgnify:FL=1|jgi:LmbE family N-acetylglucosaminyl deacetylase
MKSIKNKKRITVAILVVILLGVISFFLREFISNYAVRLNLDTIEAPGKGARVLVFAPHNDDETLGAAELIKETIKNGGEVKVALITNGDGFKEAIQFDYYNLNPKPKDYIDFGYIRQKESIEALNLLGVPKKNVIFLGYPDGGVSYLWNTYWDMNNTYISRHTQSNKSSYSNSYTKEAPYTGESVARDISKIINEYKPTYIVYPHPNDRHPDHWATNGFVKYVLASMNYKPEKELLYLVHRGYWPTPMKNEPGMYLVPPAKLIGIGTNWHALNMSEQDINEKKEAINSYKSQIKTLGPLLTAFERKNELLGEYSNAKLFISDNISGKIQPSNKNKVITDPLQDSLNLNLTKGADISGIYVEEGRNKDLNILIEANDEIENLTKYSINMILFMDNNIKRLNLQIKNGVVILTHVSKESIMNVNGIKAEVKGNILHVTIPSSTIGGFNHMFINADTSFEDRMIDKTAWRMVDR